MNATTENQKIVREKHIWAVAIEGSDKNTAQCLENLGFQRFERSRSPSSENADELVVINSKEICREPTFRGEDSVKSKFIGWSDIFGIIYKKVTAQIQEYGSWKISLGVGSSYQSKIIDEIPRLSEIDRFLISMRA